MSTLPYILAIDIDDTLADTAATVMHELQKNFPLETPRKIIELLVEYDQPGNIPSWQESEAQSLTTSLLNSDTFLASIPTIPGSKEAVESLTQHHTVGCYITSRLFEHTKVTQEWLQTNGYPTAPVVARYDWQRNVSWKLKYLAQSELNAPNCLLIDDAKDAFATTPSEYLGQKMWFNRWKKQLNLDVEYTINSWEAAVELLNETDE